MDSVSAVKCNLMDVGDVFLQYETISLFLGFQLKFHNIFLDFCERGKSLMQNLFCILSL